MSRATPSIRSRATFAAILAVALPAARILPGEPPRSIIQPAGELATADRASPAAGLVTSRAPEVLREQLALPSGAGLVVDSIAPGSVAERAGLKRHDLLVTLDEQLLVLPEQLSALAAAAPDAALALEVRRAGRTITVALGAPTPSATANDAPAAGRPATTMPLPVPPAASTQATPLPPLPGARRLGPDAVVLEDRDGRLKVYRDGDTRLSVRDARGWLVFNGPIDTPAQRALVPRRFRDRVERLEVMLDTVADALPPSVGEAPPSVPRSMPPSEPAPSIAAAADPAPARPPLVPETPVAEVGSLDVAPIEIR